jgi:hypothetical protein
MFVHPCFNFYIFLPQLTIPFLLAQAYTAIDAEKFIGGKEIGHET